MVLYTIIPPEQIFDAPQDAAYRVRSLHNSYIEGTAVGEAFCVSRLITTDPKLYLDPRFSPGSMLGDKI